MRLRFAWHSRHSGAYRACAVSAALVNQTLLMEAPVWFNRYLSIQLPNIMRYHLPKPQAVHSNNSWPSHSAQVGWHKTHWFFSRNCPLGQDSSGDFAYIQAKEQKTTNSVKSAFIVSGVVKRIYSQCTESPFNEVGQSCAANDKEPSK